MGFVRVKGPDGAEFSISEEGAASMGDEVSVLEGKPALDINGRVLPPKYPTNLAGESVTSEPSLSWRRSELADKAGQLGIEVVDSDTKADILAAIEAANDQNPEA